MSEIPINLNEIVKFKLTDHGKDVYFHRYDELIKLLCKKGINVDALEMGRYPFVDKNGYSEMQLWSFIDTYGEHIFVGAPNVIEPLELLYVTPKDLVEVTRCKDCNNMEDIDGVLYCTYFNKNVSEDGYCSEGC